MLRTTFVWNRRNYRFTVYVRMDSNWSRATTATATTEKKLRTFLCKLYYAKHRRFSLYARSVWVCYMHRIKHHARIRALASFFATTYVPLNITTNTNPSRHLHVHTYAHVPHFVPCDQGIRGSFHSYANVCMLNQTKGIEASSYALALSLSLLLCHSVTLSLSVSFSLLLLLPKWDRSKNSCRVYYRKTFNGFSEQICRITLKLLVYTESQRELREKDTI